MIFKPAPSADGRRAVMATALLVTLDLLLVLIAYLVPVGPFPFLVLVLAILIWAPIAYTAWRAWVCLSLRYQIDRNAVTLVWGPIRQTIPLGAVQKILRDKAVVALAQGKPLVRGPNGQVDAVVRWLANRWPRLERWVIFGPELGTRRLLNNMQVYSLASRPLPEQLLLVTAAETFGIAPADPAQFLKSLNQHHQLGPTHLLQQRRHYPRVARFPLWRDRLLLGVLLAGFAGLLLLMGIATTRFTSLPFALPQWDNLDRRLIFVFPAFGFAVWVINGVWGLLIYRRHRVAAGLLWSGVLVAQAAALAALLNLTSG